MARRIARTWSGGVLVLGALLLFARCLAGSDDPWAPAAIIGGTWLIAFLTYHAVRTNAARTANPEAFARASLIVPSIGVLLLLPLTLHLPFFALAGDLDDFAGWVALSAGITAPTTIVAGILIAIRAVRLAEGRPATGVFSPWGIYGIGVAATGPFLVLVLPGVLIALTALPFVPLIAYQEKLVAKERAIRELGEIPAALARFKAVA